MGSIDVYGNARTRYSDFGIDTDDAISRAMDMAVSLHCWQADDVAGFENHPDALSGGGIMATGNYPGRARNGDEVRADIAKAISLIPGKQRVNIHAIYSETDEFVDRDNIYPECFGKWIAWGREKGLSLDFNPTFFAHPNAEDNFTLSHRDEAIRGFWIEHGKACRRIAQAMAEAQGNPCNINWWAPDGSKDIPADRFSPRSRMAESYDRIFEDATIDESKCVDYIESKLFGIALEEYTVGSAEFCADYALTRKIGLCLDMGHFHPTETVHGKISSHLQFMDRLLLHVSRPVRWDSDHVTLFNDDIKNVFLELKRGDAWNRVALALDYFDASINRIAAYVIGTRAVMKALLYALLDPSEALFEYEQAGKNAQRLALMEEFKSMPFSAVWDEFCDRAGVPVGTDWLGVVEQYEKDVLSRRG